MFVFFDVIPLPTFFFDVIPLPTFFFHSIIHVFFSMLFHFRLFFLFLFDVVVVWQVSGLLTELQQSVAEGSTARRELQDSSNGNPKDKNACTRCVFFFCVAAFVHNSNDNRKMTKCVYHTRCVFLLLLLLLLPLLFRSRDNDTRSI